MSFDIHSLASDVTSGVAGVFLAKVALGASAIAGFLSVHKGLYSVQQNTALVTEIFGKFHGVYDKPGLTFINLAARVVSRPNLRDVVQDCEVKSQDAVGLTYTAFGNFSYRISDPKAAWYSYQNPQMAERAVQALVESHIQQEMANHTYDDARKSKTKLQDAVVAGANKDLTGEEIEGAGMNKSGKGYEILRVTLKDLVPGEDYILASDQSANAARLRDAANSRGLAQVAELDAIVRGIAAKVSEIAVELPGVGDKVGIAVAIMQTAVAMSSSAGKVTLVSIPDGVSARNIVPTSLSPDRAPG